MDTIIQSIAHHRGESLIALIMVVAVHGWLLSTTVPDSALLTGNIARTQVIATETSLVACEPLYQYAARGQDVALTAQGIYADIAWQAPDAVYLSVQDSIAIVRYGVDDPATTHIVTLVSGDARAECLIILR